MQLISYRQRQIGDEAWRAGVEHEGRVVDVGNLLQTTPAASGMTMRQLLAVGSAALRAVFAQAHDVFTANTDTRPDAPQLFQAASVEIGPPIPDPDKIICVGLNYAAHAEEAGMAPTTVPVFFAKFRNSLIGPTSPIHLPKMSTQIDYEGELAVIIGTRCKAVAAQDALHYVAGYSIMNDVSARDLQMQTSQWTAGKALDTFAPMGPGIVPAWEIPDPQALTLSTLVNGQVVQHASTSTMLFSVAAIIAFLSSLMTLEAGDVIATGTPAGVGFQRNPPLFLHDGDVVEVTIDGIGALRNPVTRPQS